MTDGAAADASGGTSGLAPDQRSPLITVLGEALIDLVPGAGPGDYHARPGGSPFNVAIGLARLGHRTALMARLADNAFGRLLRAHAAAEDIDLGSAPSAGEPTTLAVVSLSDGAQADYDFYIEGTADWQWTEAEASRIPADTAVFHVGSLASWTEPGYGHIFNAAADLHVRGDALISYDPNIRPALLEHPIRARALVERYVCIAHIVKASRDDVEWLYPDASLDYVSTHWLGLGALLVVITDGPRGAYVFREGAPPMHRPGHAVHVVDTIGAGDAFTSALLGGLVRRGLRTPDRLWAPAAGLLAAAVDEAVLVSAVTCERVGADPPFAAANPYADPGEPISRRDLRLGRERESVFEAG